MANEAQPRLAVILHCDVVDSTTLVRKDERLAHERIRAAFSDIGGAIERYGGVVNEIRGDALVAEFPRASDAVLAALSGQEGNQERVAALNDAIAPVLRIGIALGEVVIADSTVTGAGVVLAQRLEQLAEAGGICISGAVREASPDRLALNFESLGTREVKGFDEPVSAYMVSLPPGTPVPPPQLAGTMRPRPGRGRWLVGAVVALALLAAGLATWLKPWNPKPSAREQPSIAVLAFNNMSGDPEQDYFGEGIAEDIITDLSKIPDLLVIARNSSFSYKGRNVPIKTVARELGVEYVLEGSVRRAGDSIRINAQLIRVESDSHLWAERYDGSLKEIFALQDRITKQIVTALSIRLSADSERDLKQAGTIVPEAYDAFLRGKRHLNARDVGAIDHVTRAREAFQKAVDVDPDFARAFAGLGWAYWNDFVYLNPMDRGLRIKAFELAEKSLALADNALARRLRAKQFHAPGSTNWLSGYRPKEPAKAVAELRKGVALEPSNADALAELAYTLVFAGEPQEAATLMRKAMRLNPNFPPWYHRPAGIAHYMRGDYERAVPEFQAWHEEGPSGGHAIAWLAAAYAQTGDVAASREAISKLPRPRAGTHHYSWSQQMLANKYFFAKDEDRQHFMDGLAKAGLPNALDN